MTHYTAETIWTRAATRAARTSSPTATAGATRLRFDGGVEVAGVVVAATSCPCRIPIRSAVDPEEAFVAVAVELPHAVVPGHRRARLAGASTATPMRRPA